MIEDDDLYRFVCESAADLTGGSAASLRTFWESIPPLDDPSRKAHLFAFAAEAMRALPRLRWLQEGRTPWEVFKDTRFLGNARLAKCSHVLKQDTCRGWLEANCDPADTTLYVGIHWSEAERFDGKGERPGIKQLWLPWRCEAPLCEDFGPAPHARPLPIAPPRLYALGFPHNNCGGFCVKAGHENFRLLLSAFPERFTFHAGQETAMREYLGKDVAILRDRRGGRTKPLPLNVFAAPGCDAPDDGGHGCGCFASPREEEVA